MARSSYAKRLTGQVSHNMPVLKPAISPFQKWSAPLAAPMIETASPAQPTLGKNLETADATPALSAMEPQPEVRPSRSSEIQVLAPTPVQAAISLNKVAAERREPRAPQNLTIDKSEPHSDNPPKVEAPRVDLAAPSNRRIPYRKQNQAVERAPATSQAMAQPRSAAVSFSRTRKPQEITQDIPKRKQPAEQIDMAPRSEQRDASRAQTENSAKLAIELQPRKDPASSDLSAAPMRLEPRIVERPVLPVVHRPVQESQTQTAGGVHIGTVEVRITPPPAPAPPIVRPAQARPAPAPVLSRSFTSSLGLTQGQ